MKLIKISIMRGKVHSADTVYCHYRRPNWDAMHCLLIDGGQQKGVKV